MHCKEDREEAITFHTYVKAYMTISASSKQIDKMPRIRPAGGIILSNGSENEKTSNPYSRV
jgi:hypothetical protein